MPPPWSSPPDGEKCRLLSTNVGFPGRWCRWRDIAPLMAKKDAKCHTNARFSEPTRAPRSARDRPTDADGRIGGNTPPLPLNPRLP
jgi:hypothetical protein